MKTHLTRITALCLILFVFVVAAPTAAGWVRQKIALPHGFGAEGDRQRANPVPSRIRAVAKQLSDDADGYWVKECASGGTWLYELHVEKGGQSSVIWLNASGNMLWTETQGSETSPVLLAGG